MLLSNLRADGLPWLPDKAIEKVHNNISWEDVGLTRVFCYDHHEVNKWLRLDVNNPKKRSGEIRF